MEYSKHYKDDRTEREAYIKLVGLGEIVFSKVIYDEKRGRNFLYEVTSTAIVIVKATDRKNYVITRYPARPSRIKKIWSDPTPEIMAKAIAYSRNGITF